MLEFVGLLLGSGILLFQDPPAPPEKQDPVPSLIDQCAAAFPTAAKADRLQWIGKLAKEERPEIINALLWVVQGIEGELDAKLPEPERLPDRIPSENPSNLRWPFVWRGVYDVKDKTPILDGEEVRAAAVAALAAFRKEESVKHLAKMFREGESPSQREAAIQALNGAAVPDFDKLLLLSVTTDTAWRVRAAVIDYIVSREDRNLGYLLKSAHEAELVGAVRAVSRGDAFLPVAMRTVVLRRAALDARRVDVALRTLRALA